MDITPVQRRHPRGRASTTSSPASGTRAGRHDVATDWSRGVPAAYARELADYWADDFDWRAQEARLNAFPQFTTVVDGQTIHFVHVRSAEPGATPLLMLHGYPSSFVESIRMIGPLVDPVAHGGRAEDAFHVVVPSLPGFGFSTPVSRAGLGHPRIGRGLRPDHAGARIRAVRGARWRHRRRASRSSCASRPATG